MHQASGPMNLYFFEECMFSLLICSFTCRYIVTFILLSIDTDINRRIVTRNALDGTMTSPRVTSVNGMFVPTFRSYPVLKANVH